MKRRLTEREAIANRVYCIYACNIKKRKTEDLKFTLTKKDFERLIFKPCHYCRIKPYQNRVKGRRKGIPFTTKNHGLDRKDNTKGYTKANVVTCCKWCNFIKSDHITYHEMKTIGKMIAMVHPHRHRLKEA